MTDKQITIKWHCGYFFGPPVWHGFEVFEPNECDTEFQTSISADSEELETGTLSAICPRCGITNYQGMDFCEVQPLTVSEK